MAPRQTDQEYQRRAGMAERLFILTNERRGGLQDRERAGWRSPGRALARSRAARARPPHPRLYLSIKDHLVRLERQSGLPRIVIRASADGEEHAIPFEEEAYSLGMPEGFEFDTETLRFTYSSMTTPSRIFDYDMARASVRCSRKEVPSGHNPEDYVTRRLFAPAPDGEPVPISLIYRKDTPLDGTAPCCSTATAPTASRSRPPSAPPPSASSTAASSTPSRTSAAARTRATAGTPTAGARRSPNTFSDFIAAGRISRRIHVRRPHRGLGRLGRRPAHRRGRQRGAGLFAGLIADVPFVDMLNTMLDDTLPLTPPEWPEWGNPIACADGYRPSRPIRPTTTCGHKPIPASWPRRPRRSACHLLGAGEVGGEAPRNQDGRQPDRVPHQHGGRPRRRLRPFRPAEETARHRLRAEGRWQGWGLGGAARLRQRLSLVFGRLARRAYKQFQAGSGLAGRWRYRTSAGVIGAPNKSAFQGAGSRARLRFAAMEHGWPW